MNEDILTDISGQKIVVINEIRFRGRQNIDWKDVEKYVKAYVGKHFNVFETADKIYIGSEFPSELKGSEDTIKLRGTNAKAKANATQKIPQLIECATNKRWSENKKDKHKIDAKYGWYRYTTRFALPIYNGNLIDRYNIYRIEIIVRHSEDDKLYLYDMINVKKEKETKYPT
ncbi:MAG: hypothetical protein J6C06_02165 [Lachnospiraceae bacterium]|nr:hypothetical protein [Lachnospiraceae bacterium]